jgi:uroporphyrinogen-III decarboxylase
MIALRVPASSRRNEAPPRRLRARRGFIFNTVHNIQAAVPPENILAMWEALQEFGIYR